jgi:hypothetical protein
VLAVYHAAIVATNAAADKLDAIVVIETARSLSLSHKIALAIYRNRGQGVQI